MHFFLLSSLFKNEPYVISIVKGCQGTFWDNFEVEII
jgi:hypothetical protein